MLFYVIKLRGDVCALQKWRKSSKRKKVFLCWDWREMLGGSSHTRLRTGVENWFQQSLKVAIALPWRWLKVSNFYQTFQTVEAKPFGRVEMGTQRLFLSTSNLEKISRHPCCYPMARVGASVVLHCMTLREAPERRLVLSHSASASPNHGAANGKGLRSGGLQCFRFGSFLVGRWSCGAAALTW